jgi:hypothetical protein
VALELVKPCNMSGSIISMLGTGSKRHDTPSLQQSHQTDALFLHISPFLERLSIAASLSIPHITMCILLTGGCSHCDTYYYETWKECPFLYSSPEECYNNQRKDDGQGVVTIACGASPPVAKKLHCLHAKSIGEGMG